MGARGEGPLFPHQMPLSFSPEQTDLCFFVFFTSPFLVLQLRGYLSNISMPTTELYGDTLGLSAIVGKGKRTTATPGCQSQYLPRQQALLSSQWRTQRPGRGKIKLLCVKTQPSTISFSAVQCRVQTYPQCPRGSRWPSKHTHSKSKRTRWLQKGYIEFRCRVLSVK